MNVVIVLLINWFALGLLVAQDSSQVAAPCYTKKTFVIRKKKKDQLVSRSPKKEIVTIPNQKKIEKNIHLTDSTQTIQSIDSPTVLIRPKEELPAKFPSLAGGEFGLMNIQIYKEKMNLKHWKYVVLEYSVNRYGWANKVKVLKTNDNRLKELVLRRLRRSKWNPAINKGGQAMEYKMYPQVVIVKDRTYEEDYGNDY